MTTPATEMGIEPLVERVARAIWHTQWEEPWPREGGIEHAQALEIARAAIAAYEATRTPEAAQVETLIGDAEFLCARVRELEGDLEDGHTARQYFGHVIPALARMEDALAQVRHPSGERK